METQVLFKCRNSYFEHPSVSENGTMSAKWQAVNYLSVIWFPYWFRLYVLIKDATTNKKFTILTNEDGCRLMFDKDKDKSAQTNFILFTSN